jgi:hypothetical protein
MVPNVKIKEYLHKTAVLLPPAVHEKECSKDTISHNLELESISNKWDTNDSLSYQ